MPPPPPSLSTMSEEELRELEQEGRRGLEARLQCLQNIHTLLDAAMLNIHHYLTTVATLRYPMTFHWNFKNAVQLQQKYLLHASF